MRATRLGVLGALAVAWVAARAPAQTLDLLKRVKELEGKTIARVDIRGAADPDAIQQYLRTKPGAKLRASTVEGDLISLWRNLKVLTLAVLVTPVVDAQDQVVVEFRVQEERSYDRVVFRGLDAFSEDTVRERLGLETGNRMTEFVAHNYRLQLEQMYMREGYPFVRAGFETDPETSTLTFVIDEGVYCKVGRVQFRGNKAFPAWTAFNFGRSLLGSAYMEVVPGFFSNAPYSEEKVEEDLDRLRVYYRRHGYRDAQVELADKRFTADGTRVDLVYRVVEGERYKIRSVSMIYVDAQGKEIDNPRYPAEEVLGEVRVEAGSWYDRDAINRDRARIERFYGKRGHPRASLYSRASSVRPSDVFRLLPVSESFDLDKPEIDLAYVVQEGAPKRLRDVRIRGNTWTQDRIVRRKVFLFPGDLVDTQKLNRSMSRLEALRYFHNPDTLRGVQFELLPVTDSEGEVDLDVSVTEGDTGQFLWGAGISSGAGVQARIQFNKRNFDLFRLPSSINPITWVSEIVSSEAFHGAGQELQLFLAPGTELSTFRISLDEPDLFRSHFDTVGATISAYRTLRLFDSFDMDRRGVTLGLRRNFTDHFRLFSNFRQETVEVEGVDGNAPAIVWDAEGQTELRGLEGGIRYTDLDNVLYPTSGLDVTARAGLFGGIFGAEEDFWDATLQGQFYLRLHRDSYDRSHVLFLQQRFDFGHAYGDSNDLFLTERYYLGGSTLRGFKQRGVGPKQFGNPVGGEARYISRLEYQFPLVSTRIASQTRETEILRGVVFTDAGLLGLGIDDPTFREPRISTGFGLRIRVPGLGLPIALDFGWPMVWEETDSRRVFYFSLSR